MKRGVSTWQRWVWLALLLYSPALWASREGAGIAEGLAWLFGLLLLFGIGSALGELCSGVLKVSAWWLLFLPMSAALASYVSFDVSTTLVLSIFVCSVSGWLVGAIIGRYPTLVYLLAVLWITVDVIAIATMFHGDVLAAIVVLPNVPWLLALFIRRYLWANWVRFYQKLRRFQHTVDYPVGAIPKRIKIRVQLNKNNSQIYLYLSQWQQRIQQNGWWRWLFCSLVVYGFGFIVVALLPIAWIGGFFNQLGLLLNQPIIDLSLGPQRLWQDFGGSPSLLVGGLWAWWWGS